MTEPDRREAVRLFGRAFDVRPSRAQAARIERGVAQALEGLRPASVPDILTFEELAAWLRTPPDALRPHLHEIPCFELAGRLLFRREAVRDWIARREKKYAFQLLEDEVRRLTREGVPLSLD